MHLPGGVDLRKVKSDATIAHADEVIARAGRIHADANRASRRLAARVKDVGSSYAASPIERRP